MTRGKNLYVAKMQSRCGIDDFVADGVISEMKSSAVEVQVTIKNLETEDEKQRIAELLDAGFAGADLAEHRDGAVFQGHRPVATLLGLCAGTVPLAYRADVRGCHRLHCGERHRLHAREAGDRHQRYCHVIELEATNGAAHLTRLAFPVLHLVELLPVISPFACVGGGIEQMRIVEGPSSCGGPARSGASSCRRSSRTVRRCGSLGTETATSATVVEQEAANGVAHVTRLAFPVLHLVELLPVISPFACVGVGIEQMRIVETYFNETVDEFWKQRGPARTSRPSPRVGAAATLALKRAETWPWGRRRRRPRGTAIAPAGVIWVTG